MANLDGKALNALADIGNDGTITKSDIGLGNVDNTSDANKPVSTAVRTELDAIKENVLVNTNEIADIENVINSMNPNQEARTTVTGVDTISLPKTAANTGMQVQLFGQSAENLVVNGDFRNGTTKWSTTSAGTLSAVSNEMTYTVVTPSSTARIQHSDKILNFVSGNKYYGRFFAFTPVTTASCRLYIGSINPSPFVTIQANTWTLVSGIATPTSNNELGFYIPTVDLIAGQQTKYRGVMLINLTATFGAGNEPTKEQCDVLFANYFEGSDNVLGTGRVRSVGKNLFDSNLENGNVLSNGTLDAGGGLAVRSKNFISIEPSKQYTITGTFNNSSNFIRVLAYDVNKNFISVILNEISAPNNTGVSFITPANTEYLKFRYYNATALTTSNVLTVQLERNSVATAYEPYRQSILQLTTPELRSNGTTKDEIRKGTNGYELVKRVGVGTLGANAISGGDFEGGLIGSKSEGGGVVSTWTLNTTNPISGAQDGRLQVTTIGTSSSSPRLDISNSTRAVGQLRRLSFNYKLNSGTFAVMRFYKGSTTAVDLPNSNFSGSGSYTYYYVADGTAQDVFFFDGRNLFDIQFDNIKDELVNTPDGLAVGNTATVIGSNIHYTLATPTITPIAHAGLLNSNSNGTAYFEPIIADAGVYGTSLAIQQTAYPIASFESIRKYADGTYTELSLTSGLAIAPDGLSFTHTGLVSGDLVMFTYNYNKESIGRSMTLTHYDNRYVIADTANSKVYRWAITSTNGVASITLTEV